jgi:hypothetical protein
MSAQHARKRARYAHILNLSWLHAHPQPSLVFGESLPDRRSVRNNRQCIALRWVSRTPTSQYDSCHDDFAYDRHSRATGTYIAQYTYLWPWNDDQATTTSLMIVIPGGVLCL